MPHKTVEHLTYWDKDTEAEYKMAIVQNDDGTWSWSAATANDASVDVFVQDQTSPAFDQFFLRAISTTTLELAAAEDAYTVEVAAGHSLTAGDFIGIIGVTRAYQGQIISIAVNVLTLDTPINFAFPAGSTVVEADRELNVDGTAPDRITFVVSAPTDQTVDITRIMMQMQLSNAPDFSAFGDIALGLANGVVLRANNGVKTNYWNVKNNAEFAHLAYDYNTYAATNPAQGVWGIALRYSFAGQDKHGVAVRLEPGDALEIIIQDDLSSLLLFRMIAEGHIIVD